jgi:hypothetical protein
MNRAAALARHESAQVPRAHRIDDGAMKIGSGALDDLQTDHAPAPRGPAPDQAFKLMAHGGPLSSQSTHARTKSASLAAWYCNEEIAMLEATLALTLRATVALMLGHAIGDTPESIENQ